MDKVPDELRDRLGIAIAKRTYKAYRALLDSPRWQRVFNAGAAATAAVGQHGNQRSESLGRPVHQSARGAFHREHHARGTLKALADHGELGPILPADGGDCEEVLAQFAKAGVDVDALAAQLQDEGAKSFVKSWNELMGVIASKSAALEKVS